MQCPICNKLVEESKLDQPQPAYPFCSERCKLLDLGRWLDGGYQISVVDDAKDPDADDRDD